MPDVTACVHRAHLLVIGRYLDAVENTLGSRNLIGAHNHQNFFRGKYAIFSQHIQNGVLGKERLCKINKVCNYLVVTISPERSKLKTVACFLRFLFCGFAHFLDVAVSCGVGIILSVRTVGDNENLNVLIQTACCPKAIPLIAFDLVKGFTDGNTTAFQLHMDKWQTVDENGHVIASVVVALGLHILIDDLQTVVVDVLFVDELNIFGGSVITA